MRALFVILFGIVGIVAPALAHDPVHMQMPAVAFDMDADSVSVPFELTDGHVVIEVQIDGKGPFRFLFDTGAHGSVIDRAFAREQGLAMGPEITVSSPGGKGRPGNLATIGTLEIGGLTLKSMMTVAFDGLPFARSATSPQGVLSPYGMSGLLVTLDYPAGHIVFRRGALPKPDGREIFGWDLSKGLPEFPATVAGESVMLHLDSGAPDGLSLPTSFQKKLPLDGPIVDMGYAKLVDAVMPASGARIRGAFVIGRYSVDGPLVQFVDIDKTIGSVGARVLYRFAVTIDPANRRTRLAGPADGHVAEAKPTRRYYGVQFAALGDDPMAVRVVDAGSPAEKAGLRAGDRIVSINGHSVAELDLVARVDALRNSPLRVSVKRGRDTMDVSMTLD